MKRWNFEFPKRAWAAALVLVVLPLLAFQCTGGFFQMANDTDRANLVGMSWTLDSLTDADGNVVPLLPDVEVSLEFPEAGRFGGSASCNRYFGSYEVDGDRISISEAMGMTMMHCGDVIMEQEGRYVKALASTQTFGFDGQQLQLFGADGAVLTFVKAS